MNAPRKLQTAFRLLIIHIKLDVFLVDTPMIEREIEESSHREILVIHFSMLAVLNWGHTIGRSARHGDKYVMQAMSRTWYTWI